MPHSHIRLLPASPFPSLWLISSDAFHDLCSCGVTGNVFDNEPQLINITAVGKSSCVVAETVWPRVTMIPLGRTADIITYFVVARLEDIIRCDNCDSLPSTGIFDHLPEIFGHLHEAVI